MLIQCLETTCPSIKFSHSRLHIFTFHHHHCAVCLTAGPLIYPEGVLHRLRCSASSFMFQYLVSSFRISTSCSCLLPHLPFPYIQRSIKCFKRSSFTRCNQFRKLSLILLYVRRIYCKKYKPSMHNFIVAILIAATCFGHVK